MLASCMYRAALRLFQLDLSTTAPVQDILLIYDITDTVSQRLHFTDFPASQASVERPYGRDVTVEEHCGAAVS